jgi:hypothetical protein
MDFSGEVTLDMVKNSQGLTTQEVLRLQETVGFNEIRDRSKKWPQILWEQVCLCCRTEPLAVCVLLLCHSRSLLLTTHSLASACVQLRSMATTGTRIRSPA